MNGNQRWRNLVTDIRKGCAAVSKIDEALSAEEQKTFQISFNTFKVVLDGLTRKGHLITELQQAQFEYCSAVDRGIQEGDKEKRVEQILVKDNQCERVLCSSDTLNEQNQSKWKELCSQLISERQASQELRLIYADFSYCSYKLRDMMILPSNKKKTDFPNSAKTSSTTAAAVQLSSTQSSSTTEIINILLLGELGVGKSTFINAFANYLTFKTLAEAQSREPTVLIPVSFLITVNDQFEEQIVKFGNIDNSNNEDHSHPGQSVTQHCKSYVFDLNDGDGKKVRIIDTPGFGDTRGIVQDDLNMQHILAYIDKLTHLHAICFLLKPNTSRLNIFFRSCFMQLFEFLGENARHNIIFCFTNARSTFFAPGNTGPLLKKMLQSLPNDQICFNKTNTFCFDSESFRFLVAVQNSIEFSDHEKDQYAISWSKSVTEASRLLQYIRKNLTAYRMHVDWQSIKHAQFEINQMIRPMLESMRNILRNLVLWNMESPNVSIRLCPKVIDRSTAICLSCKRDPHRFGNIWIKVDSAHDFQDECQSCQCVPSKHIPIDYALQYEWSDGPSNFNRNEMNEMLKTLRHASTESAHFLMHVACTTQSDPFLSGINRMINEENNIRADQNPYHLNASLCEELGKMKDWYKQRRNEMTPNKEHSPLRIIYQWVESIRGCRIVQEQMVVVQEGRKRMMEKHEYEVSKCTLDTLTPTTTM